MNSELRKQKLITTYGIPCRMMNIVKAKKNKTHRKIHGAPLIESKYGFTVEFLTNAAWTCQKKYGVYEHDPYTNA
jgi:hypothetical protein